MKVYAPGTEIGSYRVLSDPMMGGMGVVYVCHDLANDRPVALKTFKPQFLPDRAARDRFLREGTAWVDLGRHPHIVRCYEVEYFDPTAFLVLELVVKDEDRADASLRSWLGQPLPLETALAFALQIARGLAHATRQIRGFVHRDLKPENVLVGQDTLPDATPSQMGVNRLRVTDFGLVAMLESASQRISESSGPQAAEPTNGSTDDPSLAIRHTQLTHGIVGTPLYMAPEQWTGGPLGVYTDVYALGCILYEMLTGQYVVSGRSIADVKAAHCQSRLRPLPNDLPGAVSGFLARCLKREGRERYPDWEAVLSALEAACAGQGVSFSAPQAEETSRAEQRDMASSYNAMGHSYLDLGNARVAVGYFEKALGILRAIGDRRGEGAALGNLGIAYRDLGDARRAIGYYEECLKLHRAIGDRRGEGADLGNLGLAYADLGDVRRAIGYYEESLKIAREIGDRRGEGNALGNLGEAHRLLGDARRAIGYYEEALKIDREIGDRRGEGNDLGNLGNAYVDLGDVRLAIGYYEQQLTIVREIGDRRGEGAALGNLGNTYLQLGDARGASGYYEEHLKIAREIGDRRGEGAALGNLGNAYVALGDARHAIGYYEQQLTIVREIGDRRGEGNALGGLGLAYARLGDARRAIGYCEQALAIFSEIDDINAVATISFNTALLYAQQGEAARALPLAQEAARILAQMGHAQYAQQAQQLVAQLQGGGGAPSSGGDPVQQALEAFQRAGSIQEMQAALAAHPILKDPQFHAAIEQLIREQVPDEAKPAFEQRLAWLKQIIKT